MRLSEWRASAPGRETASAKVMSIVEPVLSVFGVGRDPDCWVVWGDDPGVRWTVLVPAPAGLVTCHVRVNVPGEGPRANGKLTRWNRVQVGELAVDSQAGHRVVTFQVETVVLRGADQDADRIGEFAVALLAAMDGRPIPAPAPAARRGPTAAGAPKARRTGTERAAGAAGSGTSLMKTARRAT